MIFFYPASLFASILLSLRPVRGRYGFYTDDDSNLIEKSLQKGFFNLTICHVEPTTEYSIKIDNLLSSSLSWY